MSHVRTARYCSTPRALHFVSGCQALGRLGMPESAAAGLVCLFVDVILCRDYEWLHKFNVGFCLLLMYACGPLTQRVMSAGLRTLLNAVDSTLNFGPKRSAECSAPV